MGKAVLFEGPDISAHQGIVDMKRVRDAGSRFVWLRAGYGRNNVDQKYIPNAQACRSLGIPAGIYWFSYAYTPEMAQKEADYAVAQAAKFWKKCPIAYDFEYDSTNYARKNGVNVAKKLATDMAAAFLKRVREAGYIPVLYTNNDYTKNYFDIDRIRREAGGIYIWYARYSSSISAGAEKLLDIWQYTSKGSLPGVSGNVDLNKFYADLQGLQGPSSVPADRDDGGQAVKCNINIQDFQKAANGDGYKDADGSLLEADGLDGPKTRYVRRQITLKAQKSLLSWKTGSSGAVVRWWQRRCNEILGHSQRVDGLYGKTSRSETMALQQKLGLAVDGTAGYNSIQAVFYN